MHLHPLAESPAGAGAFYWKAWMIYFIVVNSWFIRSLDLLVPIFQRQGRGGSRIQWKREPFSIRLLLTGRCMPCSRVSCHWMLQCAHRPHSKTTCCFSWLCFFLQRDNIWGPFLIISPASTLNNWHQEFTRFVPKFKVINSCIYNILRIVLMSLPPTLSLFFLKKGLSCPVGGTVVLGHIHHFDTELIMLMHSLYSFCLQKIHETHQYVSRAHRQNYAQLFADWK